MPIRWDNINGANLSEASRPLESAQRSFLGAFDTLGASLKDRQAIDDANWQNTKNNNTTAYLDQVAQFRTPEALRAAQESGQLDQLRQSFGSQVDANAIRGAADARTVALQQQAKAGAEYEHMIKDERTAPVLDRFKLAVTNGDKAAADAAQAEYIQLGGRDIAGTAAFADQRAQQVTQRGRDTTSFDNQVRQSMDTHNTAVKGLAVSDANIAQSRAAIAASAAGARASDANVRAIDFNIENTKNQTAAAQAAGRAEANMKALKASGNMYADGVFNGSQTDELLQSMTKNGIGSNTEQRTEVIKALNKLQKKGIKITTPDGKESIEVHDLPMSAVTAAVNSSYNPFWVGGWNTGVGSEMKANLEEILKQQFIGADGKLKSKPVEDLAAFNQSIANARANAPGILPNRPQRPK
jgi:hypothetical protein